MDRENTNNFSKSVIYIAIIVILFVVVAGEYVYFHNKITSPSETIGLTREGPGMSSRSGIRMKAGMGMAEVTPPPLSDQQNQQLTSGTDTSLTQKTFNITGGNFYFVPNKITVNQGDSVTFVMTNAGGVHDLHIDELGVKTPVNHSGEAASVTFTAGKKGSFVYYCAVPGHRSKGMWGTFVVQ